MTWKAFGKLADVIGVVASGIGTGMTAKDIIENILDPSAGLNDAIDELSMQIDALGRKIDGVNEEANLRALNDALQLSLQSSDRMKDFPEETLTARKEVVNDAFDGLDRVLNTSSNILGSDPTPDEVLAAGSSIVFAMMVQLQSAALFSEGSYLDADATTHGGDRQHGGHRQASVRDNLIEAIETLKSLDAIAEKALDLDVTQSTTTYYATDTSMAWSDWWTRESDKAMIEFIEFMDRLSWGMGGGGGSSLTSKQITTYTVTVDADADAATIKAVFDQFFGDSYRIVESVEGGTQKLTAWVPTYSSVTIPSSVTGGAPKKMTSTTDTAATIANLLEDGVQAKIYEGSPLAGTGQTIDEVVAPLLDLVDGQQITQHDGTGVFHGTRSSTDQREQGTNPYLSKDGDDFIANSGNVDGAVLYGYGGSDYLKGGNKTDTLKGGEGNDVYFGGAGNDLLIDDRGGLDRAIFTGDASDYTVTYQLTDEGYAVIVSSKTVDGDASGLGQDGTDVLYGIESLTFDDGTIDLRTVDADFGTVPTSPTVAEGTTTFYGWHGDNTIFGRDASETLVGQGGRDALKGGGGNDTVIGGDGNDYLRGDDGNDALLGGDGADEMMGGAGNDVLTGGLGADILEGGDGADTFVFNTLETDGSVDRIVDFRSGVDKIQIDGDVFKGFGGGFDDDNLDLGYDAGDFFASFWKSISTVFAHTFEDYAQPTLVYRDGALIYDANGDKFGGETMIAHLDGAPALTMSDFEII